MTCFVGIVLVTVAVKRIVACTGGSRGILCGHNYQGDPLRRLKEKLFSEEELETVTDCTVVERLKERGSTWVRDFGD